MRIGELAASLGISKDAVQAWAHHPELIRFFSEGALLMGGASQRVFTESDALVLNTIRHLRNVEKVLDWTEIARRIDDGERFQEFPQNAISSDKRTIPIQQAEVSAKAMATLAERDAALARVEQLENEIERLHNELDKQRERSDNKIEALYREIAELRYQMGRMERDRGHE